MAQHTTASSTSTTASQEPKTGPQQAAEQGGEAGSKPEPQDDLVTSSHRLVTPRGELAYKATTGRMVLHHEVTEDKTYQGRKPKGEFSITYYTVDSVDGSPVDAVDRPVTFAFNGGPGSSSVWLHLGLLGPRRADSGDVGKLTPPPYGLLDNPETLLAVSDLVFIDPMSTGYSRAVTGEKAQDFHGFTGDYESISELIRLWTSRNGRWMSPKFLIGESYGGTRGAAIADHLQNRYGLFLNGVMFIAPALNLETLYFFEAKSDLPNPLFLPVYAATAHYHGLLPGKTLDQAVADAQGYAQEYRNILASGHSLDPQARAQAVARLASITGLSQDYVDRANLRLEHTRVYAELLRDQRLVTGRLDTRFTGPADNYIREQMPYDPFLTGTYGSYTAAFHHYLYSELDYRNDAVYEILSRAVQPWSYKEFEGKAVDVAGHLANAMVMNPHLDVYIAVGRYDGGVPAEAIQYSLDQMPITDQARAKIVTKSYPAGHMMYVHEESRLQQSADLAEFVLRSTSNRKA